MQTDDEVLAPIPPGPEPNMSEENIENRRKVAQILRDHADRVESGHMVAILACFFDRDAMSTVDSWMDDTQRSRMMGIQMLMQALLSGKVGVRYWPSLMNPAGQQEFGS